MAAPRRRSTAIDPATFLFDGPADAPRTFVLAPGAGAPMDSPFLAEMARGIAAAGVRVVRFEFPYMAAARRGQPRRAPNPTPVLESCYRAVVAALGDPSRLVLGGKSLGGRIASMVADAAGVCGVACLGYPFHPPGKPTQLRTAHLTTLRTPALIVQGERDPFGTRAEVAGYALSPQITVSWLPDGDHSFAPRVRSGHTAAANRAIAVAAVVAFVLRDS